MNRNTSEQGSWRQLRLGFQVTISQKEKGTKLSFDLGLVCANTFYIHPLFSKAPLIHTGMKTEKHILQKFPLSAFSTFSRESKSGKWKFDPVSIPCLKQTREVFPVSFLTLPFHPTEHHLAFMCEGHINWFKYTWFNKHDLTEPKTRSTIFKWGLVQNLA